MLKIRSLLVTPLAILPLLLAPAAAFANARPVIAPLADQTVQVNQTVRVRVIPSDADGQIPALRLLNSPSESSFADNRDGTRTFAWTPKVQDAGLHELVFEVSDALDSTLTSTRQLNISVVSGTQQNQAPTIEPLSDQQVVLGSSFDFTVTPIDPEGRIPSLHAYPLPAGARFVDNRNGTRQFLWTPTTAPDSVDVTFKAVDAEDSSLFNSRTVTLTVLGKQDTITVSQNQAPSIEPLSDQQIVLGSSFDFTVTPVDPEGRIPSLYSTALPEGARFEDNRNGTRQFRWTPTAAPASIEMSFTAVDADDRTLSSTQSVTLTVISAQVAADDDGSTIDQASSPPPSYYYPEDQEPLLGQGNDSYSESKVDTGTVFTSHTTAGFSGEVLDGNIHVTWNQDPDALGYNVYRQGKYVTTVWTNAYTESELYDQDYYYEIQAFDETKTIYYYVATGLTVTVSSAGRTDPAMPTSNPDLLQDYELIFADEFNGYSLDTSKWNTSFLWGDKVIINGELQHYVDIKNQPDFGYNPFTFDGNNLTINSIETPEELSDKASGQPYLSGLITSYDALKFVYGYAETRAKVTFGRSYWPAFWLLNSYYGQGGDDPEIDIMEFIGHDQDVVYHTYHYYDENGQLRSTESQPTPGIDYTGDFHTFAVEWKPGTIIYFVDGIEVHRVNSSKVSQQSMYVIANTAMGGWWAGNPDETTPFPGKYMIDYIRVYQRVTPFDDMLLDDDMTSVPYADAIPDKVIPNHRPSYQQWPAGYPHGQ